MDILAFFAHPDDETMLSGGVLARLAEKGNRIHYLCATRGEGGEVGEPPVCERADLGKVRQAELECAVKALGGTSLAFLNYVDPTVGPDDKLFAFDASVERLAEQVRQAIHSTQARAVFSHGSNGEYGHPAHVLVYQATRLAVDLLGDRAPAFYTVSAIYPDHPRPRLANKDDPADLVVDVIPVLERKLAAATCHRTQHALFLRNAPKDLTLDRPVGIQDVIMTREGVHRVYPTGPGEIDDYLISLNKD